MILATVAGLGRFFFLFFFKSQRFVDIKCHLQDSLFLNAPWCKKCNSWGFVMQVLRYEILIWGVQGTKMVVTTANQQSSLWHQSNLKDSGKEDTSCAGNVSWNVARHRKQISPLSTKITTKDHAKHFPKVLQFPQFLSVSVFYRKHHIETRHCNFSDNSRQYDAVFIVYKPPQLDWELLQIPDMLTMTSSSYLQKRIALVWTNWSFKMVRRMIRTQR